MSTECAASAPPVIAVNETKVQLHALDPGLGPCHSRRALRTCPACGLHGCPSLPVRTRPDVPAERREPADGLRVRAGHADAVTGGVRCAFSCSVHSKNAKLGSSGRSNSRSGEVLNHPSGSASYRCPSSTRWSELARESSAAVVARLPVGQHGRHSLHNCISMSISPDEQIIAQSPNGLFGRPERANKGPLPSRPKI